MSQDLIDRTAKRYYEGQMLSPKVLAQMKAMTDISYASGESTETFQEQKQGFWHTHKYLALAASLIFAVLTTVQLSYIFNAPDDGLIVRVTKEVALNHNKQLTSEYVSDSYAQLSVIMDKLDFVIKSPQNIKSLGYRLLGARYCSIQGQIAAQLKLIDEKGETATLYVTKLNDALLLLHNTEQQRDNLSIQNWHEGALFFSLAKSRSTKD